MTIPHSTSPPMSVTLLFHYLPVSTLANVSATGKLGRKEHHITLAPDSSSQSFILRTLEAIEWISVSVSPGATAAKTRTPRPIDEMTSLSTVTDADKTRWMMAIASV